MAISLESSVASCTSSLVPPTPPSIRICLWSSSKVFASGLVGSWEADDSYNSGIMKPDLEAERSCSNCSLSSSIFLLKYVTDASWFFAVSLSCLASFESYSIMRSFDLSFSMDSLTWLLLSLVALLRASVTETSCFCVSASYCPRLSDFWARVSRSSVVVYSNYFVFDNLSSAAFARSSISFLFIMSLVTWSVS